ncbi:DUF5036 family protein [Parabacteroides pacaensis]|uniref:DUF5036 family protein n=1 Tax=Parabacteroides pacaensis TaxID=2086575 RepID=UPI000D0E60DD|nr:DUF5036 family protein [Parabacteroides pacaensis]
MKTKNLWGIVALFLCSIGFASCGDDDVKEPADTVTLNMLNEENGKTLLGESDVYINKSNNFKTRSSYLVDLGKTSGLGVNAQPQLNNLAQEMAVVPGHLYQVYDKGAIREFPSGKRAVFIGAGCYNMYVVSHLGDSNSPTGAAVKYALFYPETKDLPADETLIGEVNNIGDSIEYALPKDAECVFNNYLSSEINAFNIQITDRKLTITLLEPIDKISGPYGTYGIYLRSGSIFTTIEFNAGMNR